MDSQYYTGIMARKVREEIIKYVKHWDEFSILSHDRVENHFNILTTMSKCHNLILMKVTSCISCVIVLCTISLMTLVEIK